MRTVVINPDVLRAYCDKHGLSQEALAMRADTSPKTLHRIRIGKPVLFSTVHDIAAALGISVEELLQPRKKTDVQPAPLQLPLTGSETSSTELTLTIDGEFDSYTPEEQNKLLEAIRTLLDVSGEIRVIKRRRG